MPWAEAEMLSPRNRVKDNSIFFISLGIPFIKRLQKYNFYCNSPKKSQYFALKLQFFHFFAESRMFHRTKHSEVLPRAGGYPQTPFLSFSSALSSLCPLTGIRHDYLISPFPRGGESGDVKKYKVHPEGAQAM